MFIIGALRVNEFPPQARKKMINSIWFISCRIYLFIPLEQTVRRGLSTGWPSRDTRGFGIFNRPVCMESQWHRHQSFRPLHNSAKTCTRTILLESLGRINCGAAALSLLCSESLICTLWRSLRMIFAHQRCGSHSQILQFHLIWIRWICHMIVPINICKIYTPTKLHS